MTRTEHYNDPNAPKANSIVVAASAFVQDSSGRILMIRRSDNSLWSLPGGGQEVGEFVAATAERETKEETGYDVRVTDIVGVYSNPAHVMAYSDGEVRQQFALVFRAELLGGEPATSSESPQVHWIDRSELDGLSVHPSIRLRLDHGLEKRSRPFIG